MISLRSGCLSTRPGPRRTTSRSRRRRRRCRRARGSRTSDPGEASSIAAIQAFWLAASAEADRMANSPPSSPRISRAMSAMTTPVSSKSTCAMKTLSPSPDGIGESQATTVTPASAAARTAGSIWSPAQFEIMIALRPCVVALVTTSICPETQSAGEAGPRYSAVSASSSPAASFAPWFAWSKTETPVCFGRRTDVKSMPRLERDHAALVPASARVGRRGVLRAPRRRPRRRPLRRPRRRGRARPRGPRASRRCSARSSPSPPLLGQRQLFGSFTSPLSMLCGTQIRFLLRHITSLVLDPAAGGDPSSGPSHAPARWRGARRGSGRAPRGSAGLR